MLERLMRYVLMRVSGRSSARRHGAGEPLALRDTRRGAGHRRLAFVIDGRVLGWLKMRFAST